MPISLPRIAFVLLIHSGVEVLGEGEGGWQHDFVACARARLCVCVCVRACVRACLCGEVGNRLPDMVILSGT